MSEPAEPNMGFASISLSDLESMKTEQINQLPYGVVGISCDAMVEIYNATESRLAGLPVETVIGTHFFLGVAQCMNNFLVAQRFADELDIDTVLNYVLTFRMRPTPVTLRLLKSRTSARSFILIKR